MKLRHAIPVGLFALGLTASALSLLLSSEPDAPAGVALATPEGRSAVTPRPGLAPAAADLRSSSPASTAAGAGSSTNAGVAVRPSGSAMADRAALAVTGASPRVDPRASASQPARRRAPTAEARTRALARAVKRLERQRKVRVRVTQLRRRIGFSIDDPATADLELLLAREPSPFSPLARDPQQADLDWLLEAPTAAGRSRRR